MSVIIFFLSACFVWIDKTNEPESDGFTQFEDNSTETGDTNQDSDTPDETGQETGDTQETGDPQETAEPEDTEDIDLETDFPTCEEHPYNGSTYLFCPRTFGMPGWLMAEMHCNDWGGNLATVNDFSEFEWLTIKGSMVDTHGNWWLGLNDRTTEGEWLWSSGETFDYTPGWHASSDENNDENDCVYMGRDGDGWRLTGCLSSQTFICEK